MKKVCSLTLSMVSLLVLFVFQCKSGQNLLSKEPDSDKIYIDCMKSFQDSLKCTELAYGKPKDLIGSPNRTIYSPEQLKQMNLFLCDPLFNELQAKNTKYLVDLIGAPDEKKRRTTGEVWYIYNRPICQMNLKAQPQSEIIVKVFRWRIFKVESEAP